MTDLIKCYAKVAASKVAVTVDSSLKVAVKGGNVTTTLRAIHFRCIDDTSTCADALVLYSMFTKVAVAFIKAKQRSAC